MTALEIKNNIFIFNSGSKTPRKYELGFETVIPSFEYLKQNAGRIRGLFITHAKKNCWGSLLYLIKEIKCPVFCSPFTEFLIEEELAKIEDVKGKLRIVERNHTYSINDIKFHLFSLTSSQPDAFGCAVETEQGMIYYMTDFIIETDSKEAFSMNLRILSKISSKKTLLLMMSATNFHIPSFTAPFHKLSNFTKKHLFGSKKRIVVVNYEHRITELIEVILIASEAGRKIFFHGEHFTNLFTRVCLLKYIDTQKIKIATEKELESEKVLIVITGDNLSLFPSIEKIANNSTTGGLTFHDNDTMLVVCNPKSGTEIDAARSLDAVAAHNVEVFTVNKRDKYDMHPSFEDARLIVNLIKPKFFMPINARYNRMIAAQHIIEKTNMDNDKLLMLDNGDVAEFKGGELVFSKSYKRVPAGNIYVSTNQIRNVSDKNTVERMRIATNGLILIGLGVDLKRKSITFKPSVEARGFSNNSIRNLNYELSQIIFKQLLMKINTLSNKSEVEGFVHDVAKAYFHRYNQDKIHIVTVCKAA